MPRKPEDVTINPWKMGADQGRRLAPARDVPIASPLERQYVGMGWKRTIRDQVDANPTWMKPAKNYWNIGITFPMPADPRKLEERITFARSLLEPAGWRYLGCAPHTSMASVADARFERAPTED